MLANFGYFFMSGQTPAVQSDSVGINDIAHDRTTDVAEGSRHGQEWMLNCIFGRPGGEVGQMSKIENADQGLQEIGAHHHGAEDGSDYAVLSPS